MKSMRSSSDWLVISGALVAALGVVFGAFGAHGLRTVIEASDLAVFETAVRYQMYHALGLVLTGILGKNYPHQAVRWAGWLLLAGVFLFSGSLYFLVLTGIRGAGFITPLGGVAFIVGWLSLAHGIFWSYREDS